jgi:hypothetical protein
MAPQALILARLGQARDWQTAVLNQIRCLCPEQDFCYFEETGRTGVLENRMTLREGVNALGAQRLGNASFALQLALCLDSPPAPGKDPVIRFFPALPEDWDAEFKLLCRGGFLVRAAKQADMMAYTEITSQLGGCCRLRNPWLDRKVAVYKNDGFLYETRDELIELETEKGDRLVLVAATRE